jgi:glutaconyl-CoA/methylmalonyl-CoA decarboxylase subunit gamma
MRIVVDRDGSSTDVEVAPGGEAVTVRGRTYPVVVVRRTATLVELEIAGERVVVDNWPEHFAEPPGPVDVNGERAAIRLERAAETVPVTAGTRAPAPAPTRVSAPTAAAGPAGGHAILPPMPGKVIEVRVTEGQSVRKGEVVLVLEAMKMRNELASPVDGVVRGVRTQPGANARAKEPLLYVVPG